MTIRCRICNRKLTSEDERNCWKCRTMAHDVKAAGIMARARDMGYQVGYSNVNQGYIIVDEVDGPRLVGVKNTPQEVMDFLDERENKRATKTAKEA